MTVHGAEFIVTGVSEQSSDNMYSTKVLSCNHIVSLSKGT